MHIKLFIPGPVEVRPEVLKKMATPMIGHRSKGASELQRSISNKLRKLFYTENEILLSTTSGSGLMEGAIRSCTVKKLLFSRLGHLETGGMIWRKIIILKLINLRVNGELL